MAARSGRGFGHHSGVAAALERVGERWALLIVRDLLVGSRRYGDLKQNLPRIPTNILSDRLRELQQAGVIRRVPVVRGGYELTELGRGLAPAVLALERWGWTVLDSAAEDETITSDGLAITLTAAFRSSAAADLPPTGYLLTVADAQVRAVVAEGRLHVKPTAPAAPSVETVTVPTSSTLCLELSVDELGQLLAGGEVSVNAVNADPLLDRFHRTFRIDRPDVPED